MIGSSFGANGRVRRVRDLLGLALGGAVFLAVMAGSASAQQNEVSGVVVSSRSLVGIAEVQVSVEGSDLRVMTDNEGRFRLIGLLGARVQLIVQRIGYRPATLTVQVGSSGVRIALTESAIALDEIGITLEPATGTPYRWGGIHGDAICFPLPNIERDNNPNI